ncbi:MAG: SAM-dependent methyltransferase [Proteobacteria bacterium]|nr:MAG: SAM-dependent methyltransferase [Pseudomonadota bacterium]
MTDHAAVLRTASSSSFAPTAIDRLARRAVLARLARISRGRLAVHEGAHVQAFGESSPDLSATIRVRDPRFYRWLAQRGSLGGAEAYLEGLWSTDDLVAVVRVLARNQAALAGLDAGLARIARPGLRMLHLLRRNTRGGSRRNVAAHYDLGNAFFEIFLDPTLTYSAGVFERADATLEEAQIAKYRRAIDALRLGPDDHVLEIGTGWGGFAIHAARTTGCRVTSATLSAEQHARATERVAAAGLADRVEVVLRDYRDLRGRFDKLVSIEMIEAVGHAQLPGYFRACSERLRPGGRMFLQAITVPERDFAASVRNVEFIKRYVFPGGQLVSVGAICDAIARAGSDLQITALGDVTEHYATTLRIWRERYLAAQAQVAALGFDERFRRLWEFYLAYCEGGFRERAIGTIQLTLVRPN